MKKIIVLVVIAVITIMVACKKDNTVTTEDCSTVKSYAADVSPIIQSSCAYSSGCHRAGSTNGPGALLTYQQVSNYRSAIRSAVANRSMPQNSWPYYYSNKYYCLLD